MSNYKTVIKTIQPYNYQKKGKTIEVKKSFPRQYHIKKTKIKIVKKKEKSILEIEPKPKKKTLGDYYYMDLSLMKDEELDQLAKEHHIPELESVLKLKREDKIKVLEILANRERFEKVLNEYSKKELLQFLKFLNRNSGESGKLVIEDLETEPKKNIIRHLSAFWEQNNFEYYQNKKKTIEEMTDDSKFIIREIAPKKRGDPSTRPENYISQERLYALIGEEEAYSLYKQGIIISTEYKGNIWYLLTKEGQDLYFGFEDQYKQLEVPPYKTMKKKLPPEIMKSLQILAQHEREFAVGIDYERKYEQPEQFVAIQGAKTFTYHLGDDFEIFGHTHPNTKLPRPSESDLLHMRVGRPEFIVAGETGKIAIFNIEIPDKYEQWKREHKDLPDLNIHSDESREKFFLTTGIRAYSYPLYKEITMIDDPRTEKKFPFFTEESLVKIHETEKIPDPIPKKSPPKKIRKRKEPIKEESGEIDIWIAQDKLDKFYKDLSSLNDIKIDRNEINVKDREDVRISIFYRSFSGEITFPKQDYYQLNNVFVDPSPKKELLSGTSKHPISATPQKRHDTITKEDKNKKDYKKIISILKKQGFRGKDTIFINESELKQKLNKEEYEFIDKIASERDTPGIKYVTGTKLGTRALYITPQKEGEIIS